MPRATSLPLDPGCTWYLRCRHLQSPALPDSNRIVRGLLLCRDRRPITRELFLISVFTISTWKREFRLVQQREQIILENQTFSPVLPIVVVRQYLQPVSFLNSLERKLWNIAFLLSLIWEYIRMLLPSRRNTLLDCVKKVNFLQMIWSQRPQRSKRWRREGCTCIACRLLLDAAPHLQQYNVSYLRNLGSITACQSLAGKEGEQLCPNKIKIENRKSNKKKSRRWLVSGSNMFPSLFRFRKATRSTIDCQNLRVESLFRFRKSTRSTTDCRNQEVESFYRFWKNTRSTPDCQNQNVEGLFNDGAFRSETKSEEQKRRWVSKIHPLLWVEAARWGPWNRLGSFQVLLCPVQTTPKWSEILSENH